MANDQVEFKDFTKEAKDIRFGINGVVLRARPRLGLATAQRVVSLRESMSDSGADKMSLMRDLFSMLLHSESVDDFERVMSDEDDPIDTEQLSDMIHYVMECQGLRPTQPSTESSGQPDAAPSGTTSTDGASAAG